MSDQQTPREEVRDRLGEAQAIALESMADQLRELRELADAAQAPPQFRLLEFTAATPVQRVDQGGSSSPCFTLLNPSATLIAVGVGGGASIDNTSGRSVRVASGRMLTLPLRSDQFEVAADPAALAGGPAIAFLILHPYVLPPFVGTL